MDANPSILPSCKMDIRPVVFLLQIVIAAYPLVWNLRNRENSQIDSPGQCDGTKPSRQKGRETTSASERDPAAALASSVIWAGIIGGAVSSTVGGTFYRAAPSDLYGWHCWVSLRAFRI